MTNENLCPNCHAPVEPGANFCGKCGQGIPGGKIKCPHCSEDTESGSRFCGKCGKRIDESEPQTRHSRWHRSPEEVAARFEAASLPELVRGFLGDEDRKGLLGKMFDLASIPEKGFIIEEGTKALLLQHGKSEILNPGSYSRGTVIERLKQLVKKDAVVLVLYDDGPIELPFAIDGLLSAESINVDARGSVVVRVDNPILLNNALIKGSRGLTRQEITDRVIRQIRLALLDSMREIELADVKVGAELQAKLSITMLDKLSPMLGEIGFRVDNIRGISLEGETLEKLIRHKEWRQQMDQKAQETRDKLDVDRELGSLEMERERLQREDSHLHREKIAEIQRKENELNLRIEREDRKAHIDHSEQLAALYQRAQKVELDQVRTDEETAKVLHDLDKDKVLRDEDMEVLKSGIMDRRDDKGQARRFLLEKIQLEHDLELERVKMTKTQDLDDEKIDFELKQRRKHFEHEQEEETARRKAAKEAHKDKTEMEKLETDIDMEALKKMGETKLAQQKAEQELAHRDAEHAVKLEEERLKARSEASVEALLSMMKAEGDEEGAAAILGEIAKTKQFKDMSEDKILAIQAGDSPEVAKIFQARAASAGYEDVMQAKLEAAEKAVEAEKQHAAEMKEAYDKRTEDAKEITGDAMERMTKISQTIAESSRGGGEGGGQADRKDSGAMVKCPHCSAANSPGAVFCNQCSGRIKMAEGSRECPNCKGLIPPGNKFCPGCGASVS